MMLNYVEMMMLFMSLVWDQIQYLGFIILFFIMFILLFPNLSFIHKLLGD